jgi:hypothetical protein
MNSNSSGTVLRWSFLIIFAFCGTGLGQVPEKPKRNLLFIGQAKGYQHEAISTAMATLYRL